MERGIPDIGCKKVLDNSKKKRSLFCMEKIQIGW